jgi:hypothetical protein
MKANTAIGKILGDEAAGNNSEGAKTTVGVVTVITPEIEQIERLTQEIKSRERGY